MAAITIAAAMVPTTALLVGRFGLFRALGVTDTLLPLMAPALLGESPFHVLFYLWAFRRIPPDVFDAARIEGLGEIGVYWKVAMPLVKPITVAVAVSSFVDLWGAYIEPLVYLSDPDLFTVPAGSRHARQPRSDATSRCCWPAPSRRWHRWSACSSSSSDASSGGSAMRRLAAVAVVTGCALVACGDDDGGDATTISLVVFGEAEELAAYRTLADVVRGGTGRRRRRARRGARP